MKNINDLPVLLTVKEMADFLKIKKNKAYSLIDKKQISVLRIGPQIRIPKCLLAKWIRENGIILE